MWALVGEPFDFFIPRELTAAISEDGSVRWYNLPSTKVIKAAKLLGAEIASIAWQLSKKNEPVAIWVASGRRVSVEDVRRP